MSDKEYLESISPMEKITSSRPSLVLLVPPKLIPKKWIEKKVYQK